MLHRRLSVSNSSETERFGPPDEIILQAFLVIIIITQRVDSAVVEAGLHERQIIRLPATRRCPKNGINNRSCKRVFICNREIRDLNNLIALLKFT